MLDLLPGTIRAACGDFEINTKEESDLLRLVAAKKTGDGEVVRSILLKYKPSLLLEEGRGQAMIEHVFRDANHAEHRCEYLCWNTAKRCAACTKDPRGWCTEKCPVRDAEEAAREPQEMVA